jgi:hypothetical protein
MPDYSDLRHWHDRAEKTRAQANKMQDSRFKHRMLGLAHSYDRLAEQLEQQQTRKRKPARRTGSSGRASREVTSFP